MSLTIVYVDRLFENLSTWNGNAFFDNVADDVHWTVMGTHPLAGVYKSKEDFLKNTFERLDKVLKGGVILKVAHTFVSGNIAVVEMTQTSTALNGKPFPNMVNKVYIVSLVFGAKAESLSPSQRKSPFRQHFSPSL